MSDDASTVKRLATDAERALKTLKRIGGLVDRERRTFRNVDLPLRKRAWLWRHGFLSEAGALLDPSPETVDRYLSNYARDVKTIDINGESGRVLDDKLLFHALLTPEFDHLVPRLYYYVTTDGVYPVDADADREIRDVLAAADGTPFVLKTRTGGGGEGVSVVSSDDVLEDDGEGRSLATRLSRHSRLHANASTNANSSANANADRLLCEYVEQAAYADDVFPESANTIRILTMIDPDTNEPFVARAVHRFGSNESAPLDNWSRGGLSARIDEETGRLTDCAYRTDDGKPRRIDRHPETGERITGTTIPNWNAIVETVTDVAMTLPGLPYVGWDVVVIDDPPYVTIIEGNRYSDVNMLQTFGPLLDDPRVRRFYAHHGVL